jgi:quinol monooxygenase YgiN
MFARILEFTLKTEKKEDFLKTVRQEVLPILKKQTGFLEILPLVNEVKPERIVVMSLWQKKIDAERYEKETFYKVNEILKPWLNTPVEINYFKLETSLCEHFVEAMVA